MVKSYEELQMDISVPNLFCFDYILAQRYFEFNRDILNVEIKICI